ncbi:hypothetical protein Peur_024829 [Populus x canadensis]
MDPTLAVDNANPQLWFRVSIAFAAGHQESGSGHAAPMQHNTSVTFAAADGGSCSSSVHVIPTRAGNGSSHNC